MKSWAYCFTILYLLAMYRPVAPVITYLINRDQIAELFCVNKDKPALQCHGQCYLMRILKEKQSEKKGSTPAILLSEYPIGFVRIFSIARAHAAFSEGLPFYNYLNNYHYLFSDQNDHPPSPGSLA